MEGIYNINKPIDWTSFDVVAKLRNITGIKKIGHAGTLDPKAEGVLIVCIGRKYTKQISEIQATRKQYLVGMQLGIVTDTYDSEGNIVSQESVTLDKDRLSEVISHYVGQIEQLPPMFSAVHHNGKRLYELARKGIEVERKPRSINIQNIEVKGIEESENPIVSMLVTCSTGTYIRSLCHDIGQELGCGAYASSIKRTMVGDYHIEDSQTIEEFADAIKK